MEKTFIRVRSVKDIAVFASLIVVGCLLTLLPVGDGLRFAGIALAGIGLVLAFVLKTGYEDIVTGEAYCKGEYFFAQEMKTPLLLAMNSMPETIELSEEDKGNAVRLDAYYSRTSGKAYLQLFEFIPYQYEPCSEMMEYNLYEVRRLIK